MGGHSSQFGALPDRAGAPVTPDVVLALVLDPRDAELDADPVLNVDPVVAPPAVVAVWGAVDEAVGAAALAVVDRVTAPYAFAMPVPATPVVVVAVAVCAAAGGVRAASSSGRRYRILTIGLTISAPFLRQRLRCLSFEPRT